MSLSLTESERLSTMPFRLYLLLEHYKCVEPQHTFCWRSSNRGRESHEWHQPLTLQDLYIWCTDWALSYSGKGSPYWMNIRILDDPLDSPITCSDDTVICNDQQKGGNSVIPMYRVLSNHSESSETSPQWSSSSESSGVAGPGYLSGKALKWLGEHVIDALERIIIMKTCFQHVATLSRWQKKYSNGLTIEWNSVNIPQVHEILTDLLRLSWDYSVDLQRQGFKICDAFIRFLDTVVELNRIHTSFLAFVSLPLMAVYVVVDHSISYHH
ncbi:hypothetical protein M422DRAFT_782473 [Sphaerobolus stellatus SS14]|uniref:Uncharacterized protein n=1 Tax=Sphaerobolus stellatus (strain SS14) TaxID=990650 RepID=A0A0C9VEH1_SPHS4|nr:hypothetical protein M422DRAFT_782473 [Sphaerobolus stellatus SS14]